jgi:endogenous inhibitor of DNA gyrase (YacG/DUF329 family)
MSTDTKREKREANGRNVAGGTCPRCGKEVLRKATGRPPIWCSQPCRRAAYEERRAAARGAIAVKVVDRVDTHEHPIGTCVDRTLASPAGCRRVVYELARLGRERTLQSDPKWESTYNAIRNGLMDALFTPFDRRQ